MLFGFNMEIHSCIKYQGESVRTLGMEVGMKSCLVLGCGLCGQSVVLRFMASLLHYQNWLSFLALSGKNPKTIIFNLH